MDDTQLLPQLPVEAVWINGRQKGSRILVDPYNIKLQKKTEDTKHIFFVCSKKKDLDCPVRVVYDKESDMITKLLGDHNQFNSVKSDQPDLTSNRSEAWNSSSKISLPMKPNVWVVLSSLLKEEGLARAKMVAAISGNAPADPNPGRTKLRLNRVAKLKHIVDQYGHIPINDYLNSITALYNED